LAQANLAEVARNHVHADSYLAMPVLRSMKWSLACVAALVADMSHVRPAFGQGVSCDSDDATSSCSTLPRDDIVKSSGMLQSYLTETAKVQDGLASGRSGGAAVATAGPQPTRSVLDTWRSTQCRDMFRGAIARDRMEQTTYVEEARVFMPSLESHRQAPAFPHKPASFQRLITSEDAFWPQGFGVAADTRHHSLSTANAFSHWCMPWFVRTPVRAMKAAFARCGGKEVMYIPIWKAASTSMERIMNQTDVCPTYYGFHEKNSPKTGKACPLGLGECWHDTTMMPDDQSQTFKFSFVREPWSRFMAGVHEHGLWSKNMSENMRDVDAMVKALHEKYPNKMYTRGYTGACEYATQSYLLSGTDAEGKPIDYDFLGRVENFSSNLGWLQQQLGGAKFASRERHENPSGDLTHQVSFEALKNPYNICVVCKTFLQDYVCLGYPLPETCCANQCKDVGITFQPSHLQAAGCS